jgi:MiaB-like tRNA modifying enzyme
MSQYHEQRSVELLAKVYVEAYGCSANLADSEIIQGLLLKAGHTIIKNPNLADASVLISCTVKTPTQKKIEKRIRELKNQGYPLIVAGCMPKAQRDLVVEIAPNTSMIGPDNILEVVDVVEAAIEGKVIEALEGENPNKTILPRKRVNPIIHIAPIASGCLGNCSYCIVKQARGNLTSFPLEAILDDAMKALKSGCKEIWITAEDTSAYHWDEVGLPELLKSFSMLPGRFKIRVGMMTPNQALPLVDNLIEAYKSDKVFKFLHIPVQSGDDEILIRMERQYTVEDFRRLIQKFREKHPLISISTDIICGFPGETDEQFNASLSLIEETKPDVLNISRFWPRPGTRAASMNGQHHGRVTKQRSRRLASLWRDLSFEKNLQWINWEGEVLIDEEGKSGGTLARNFAYKPIVLKEKVTIGDYVNIRIIEARRGYLIGKTI